MNKRILLIGIVAVLAIFIGMTLFIKNNKIIKLNKSISDGTISGFDLIKIAVEELRSAKPGLQFHLGLIMLEQDERQLGMARIRFVEDSKSDIPQVFEVKIDTLKSKVVDIQNFGRSDVSNPGSLSISNWMIDSTIAYQIAQSELSKEKSSSFSYNRSSITSFKGESVEYWHVQLFNSSKVYWCYINPLTGEVVEKGFKTPSKEL
jgi:hypothetical protein